MYTLPNRQSSKKHVQNGWRKHVYGDTKQVLPALDAASQQRLQSLENNCLSLQQVIDKTIVFRDGHYGGPQIYAQLFDHPIG